jgi:hypothetical protein
MGKCLSAFFVLPRLIPLFFCIPAKGFAGMHGDAKRQSNKNNKLALAWQMHYI